MALDRAQALSILTYLHKATGTTAPRTLTGPFLVRLMAAMGADSSANGTGITGTYGSTGLTSGTWTQTSSTQTDAAAAISYTSMPSASTVGIEVWSSDATPLRTEYGTLTGGTKTTASGDTLSFSAGAITSALA